MDADTNLAIVSIGVGSGEGSDRTTMFIDPHDVTLIRDVAKECKQNGIKCAVILNACAPVETASWVDEVDAVLLAWMSGQEIGHAVADIISGEVCPSGKLPITFPKRYEDSPAFLNFPGEFDDVLYGEGIYVGYRYYDTVDIEPQYEFGYGLSYTTFRIGNVQTSADVVDFGETEKISVSVDVKNTGEVYGEEVVQLYISDVYSSVRKAKKELKAFKKVGISPGETTTVAFELLSANFSHFDAQIHDWCIEPGLFDISIGSSSRLIHTHKHIRIIGANPYAYDMNTPISRIMKDDKAVDVLKKHFPGEVLDDPQLLEINEFIPNVPFQRVWSQIFVHHLADLNTDEVEKLREGICLDFARIRID